MAYFFVVSRHIQGLRVQGFKLHIHANRTDYTKVKTPPPFLMINTANNTFSNQPDDTLV